MSFESTRGPDGPQPPHEPRLLRDPRAIRALAHPLRLELLDLVAREGPITATRAAERTGETGPSCSFHLRQLAKYGFIEDAGPAEGRERPWRIVNVDLRFASGSSSTETAVGLLNMLLLQRDITVLETFLTNPARTEPEWRDAALLSTSLVFVTLDELRALGDAILGMVSKYVDRTEDAELRPEGARPVRMLNVTFPVPSQPE